MKWNFKRLKMEINKVIEEKKMKWRQSPQSNSNKGKVLFFKEKKEKDYKQLCRK